ncbi:hypothetical protein CTAYLR_002085 [Chrysophaeum taylorii]|uniref:Enoyl reductase (ER) domain-containing protein n=1 Tax=Chrysophaeum taylorii TaxID=2483200 RepID=A0AAD7XRA5_9STRA|nr:hypothetical protein CTAYLR_002085 [Chrysophaeum taylorii]
MWGAIYDLRAPEGVRVARRPKPRGVVVRVVAAGMNPVDAKFVVGDKISCCAERIANGHGVGFDFSGVTESGDAVFGILGPFQGSVSEFVRISPSQVAPKPKSLSFVEAAALPVCGLTSLALRGERVLVIGASGGVGHLAVQVAVARGAAVTGISSSRNSEFVKSLGATPVAYDGNDFHLEGPFDAVLDTVHSSDPRDCDYREIVRGARYVTTGGHFSDWFKAGVKKLTGISLFPKDRELFWIDPFRAANGLRELADLADTRGLKPHVSEVLPFTDEGLRAAFKQLRSRRTVGKIVIQVSDPRS